MKQNVCGNCGELNNSDAKFCTNCGEKLEEQKQVIEEIKEEIIEAKPVKKQTKKKKKDNTFELIITAIITFIGFI